jgi:hypothetical protein
MAALTTEGSIPKKLEDLLGSHKDTTTPVIKAFIRGQVTTANPADITQLDNASSIVTATATLSGVAAGDLVVAVGYVSGLAAGQLPAHVYVSGTDELTFLFTNVENTAVTTTAVVANVVVADVT